MRRIANVPGTADVRLQQSSQLSRVRRRCGSHARRRTGGDRARCHQQPGRQSLGQLSGGARILAQSAHRRVLSDRRPDAAISTSTQCPRWRTFRLRDRAGEAADSGRVSARFIATTAMRLSRTTPLNPPSTFMRPRRDAISAPSAADIQNVIDQRARATEGHDRHFARPSRNDEYGLFRPVLRPRGSDRADLSADRGQFSVLDRPIRDHHGASGGTCGIVWMLFTTGTPLSVPALTGAIMCMGVATANSVLVVSFARQELEGPATPCARLSRRASPVSGPVIMTALAMIIGMAPMALGLGEGGEQNAPLGRAVIGGLCLPPVATLAIRACRLQSCSWTRIESARRRRDRGRPIERRSLCPLISAADRALRLMAANSRRRNLGRVAVVVV